MNISTVYVKFEDKHGKFHYFSVEELMEIGTPIDEDGEEMEGNDSQIYIVNNGKYLPA